MIPWQRRTAHPCQTSRPNHHRNLRPYAPRGTMRDSGSIRTLTSGSAGTVSLEPRVVHGVAAECSKEPSPRPARLDGDMAVRAGSLAQPLWAGPAGEQEVD